MMLRLVPDLVIGDVSQLETVPFGFGFEPAYRGWTTNDRTVPGHIGSPQHATAAKGEQLFATFAGGVEQFLLKVGQWDGSRW
jgi:creatinine amidohydrolase